MKPVTLLFAVFLAAFSVAASALDVVPYSPEKFAEAQLAGKSVALHFHANWCPICRAQKKVIEELRADKSLPLTVYVADYDTVESLREKLHVTMQSTLIVYKGLSEKARIVGETDPKKIRAALAAGL